MALQQKISLYSACFWKDHLVSGLFFITYFTFSFRLILNILACYKKKLTCSLYKRNAVKRLINNIEISRSISTVFKTIFSSFPYGTSTLSIRININWTERGRPIFKKAFTGLFLLKKNPVFGASTENCLLIFL